MTQQRVWIFPTDPFQRGGRISLFFQAFQRLIAQRRKHVFHFFTAIKNRREKTQRPGSRGNGWCTAKVKPHSLIAQLIGSLGKFSQQTLAGLGGKAVRHPHQLGAFTLGGADDFLHRHGGTEENSTPATGFSKAQ